MTTKTTKKRPVGRPRTAKPSSTTTLPIYHSLAACFANAGVPVSVQKESKRQKCAAFDSAGRVSLEPLLRFLFSRDDAEAGSWDEVFKRARAKREEIRLSRDQGNLADRGLIRDGLAQLAGLIEGGLRSRFVNEFPPAVQGLDAMAVASLAKKTIEDFWQELKSAMEAITEGKESENI